MKWNRYSIKTTTQAVDLISSALDDIGIEGIEIQDNVQLTQEEAKTMFVDLFLSCHQMMEQQLLIFILIQMRTMEH